jgi:hypothetical protein
MALEPQEDIIENKTKEAAKKNIGFIKKFSGI